MLAKFAVVCPFAQKTLYGVIYFPTGNSIAICDFFHNNTLKQETWVMGEI